MTIEFTNHKTYSQSLILALLFPYTHYTYFS